jgi:hypothetical protein
VRRRNIDWLSGVWFVDPKIRVGLEFMTSRLRTRPYLVSGFLSYLSKMVSGKWIPKPASNASIPQVREEDDFKKSVGEESGPMFFLHTVCFVLAVRSISNGSGRGAMCKTV